MATESDLALPAACHITPVRFDHRFHVILWGPDSISDDGSGADRVASLGRRIMTWPDVESCREQVSARGWTLADELEQEDPAATIDLDPAQAWLRGERATINAESALSTWNLAGDVAFSLALPFRQGGGVADDCYTKLTAANVPWLFDRDSFTPRWTRREVMELRRVLGEAVGVLRAGFG